MEQSNQPKTLAHVFNREGGGRERFRGRDEKTLTTSFNTYVNVFSLNVVSRYPDVTNLETIPYDEIQRIADFSAACTPIILETWERVWSEKYRQAA